MKRRAWRSELVADVTEAERLRGPERPERPERPSRLERTKPLPWAAYADEPGWPAAVVTRAEAERLDELERKKRLWEAEAAYWARLTPEERRAMTPARVGPGQRKKRALPCPPAGRPLGARLLRARLPQYPATRLPPRPREHPDHAKWIEAWNVRQENRRAWRRLTSAERDELLAKMALDPGDQAER